MAPLYQRPPPPVPTAWPEGPAYKPAREAAREAPDIGWREFFADPKLAQVIELALENNRDLRVAIANIQGARGIYQVQRSLLFPTIDANVRGVRSRVPAATFSPGADGHVTSTSYSANLATTNYELDLFGGLRSGSKSARERYLASEEGRRAFQISLVSEVASSYLTISANRAATEISRKTLESAQESYQLARRRFEAGVASELDLRQAETLLQQARRDVAQGETITAQSKNALDLLVGAIVSEDLLAPNLDDQAIPSMDVPAGLTSDILLRRPDILAAEHRLKSANADIGAARAAFFPQILITLATGGVSPAFSNVLNTMNSTSSGTLGVTQTLFAGGRNIGALSAANASKKIAVAEYERAVQAAFREVADALAERGTIDERSDAQRQLTEAASISARLSTARYEKGVDSYLATLDSQRTLYAAQRGLIGVKLDRALSLIGLYKALGGGLDPDDEAAR